VSAAASDPTAVARLRDLVAGDSASIAFADEERGWYGYARLELDARGTQARSFVAVFGPGQPALMSVSEADAGEAPPLRFEEADGGWTATFAMEEFPVFALRGEGPPVWSAVGTPEVERHLARVMVSGESRMAGEPVPFGGPGQLTVERDPVSADAAVRRELAVWLGEQRTVDLTASARKRGKGHDTESIRAAIVSEEPRSIEPVAESRLSTTYDADERPLRVGLELWPSEDAPYARRIAGDTLDGRTITVNGDRFDVAFLRWRMEGDTGIGPYALWRAGGKR
jgi:hypothetical protein